MDKAQTIDISRTAKTIRAHIIKRHMEENHIDRCVCFSCGNASRAIKDAGIPCVEISPGGDLSANRWRSMNEIRNTFPDSFDATSGHLPMDMMNQLAAEFRIILSDTIKEGHTYTIPTGSGETVICLRMAFPKSRFIAQWDNQDPSCEYSDQAPMAQLVKATGEWEIING